MNVVAVECPLSMMIKILQEQLSKSGDSSMFLLNIEDTNDVVISSSKSLLPIIVMGGDEQTKSHTSPFNFSDN